MTFEQIRRVFKHGVPAYVKPMNTLHGLFARLKDKILKERVVAPVYHIQWDSCDASNIGQTEDRKKHGFWSIEDPAPPPRKRQNVFIYRQSFWIVKWIWMEFKY